MATVSFRRGKWNLDYYHNGARIRKTLKCATKAEAKAELRVIEDAIAKGVYLPEKKIPTFGKVCQDWLEYMKTRVRASSLKSYTIYADNHFGVFADVRISAITTAKIESFITEKQMQGMPIKTVRYIIGLLNQVLNYAVGTDISGAIRYRRRKDREGQVNMRGKSLPMMRLSAFRTPKKTRCFTAFSSLLCSQVRGRANFSA